MKRLSIALLILFTVAFSSASCRGSKEKNPGDVRLKKDRAVTIINNTGYEIIAYEVNVAGSKLNIARGDTASNSFSIKIPKDFNNDPRLEVVLVDKYKRIYAKEFDVPLKGNTDTPLTAGDKQSSDLWTEIIIWLNEHK